MRFRLLAIAVTVLLALVALSPTLWPGFDPPWLHDSRVTLTPSIAGGTELVLDVDVDAAVVAEVQDDAEYLRGERSGGRVSIVDQVAAEPGATLVVYSSAELSEIVDVVHAELDSYVYVDSEDGLHRFELSEERRDRIEERVVSGVVEVTQQRLTDQCGEGATLERVGPD